MAEVIERQKREDFHRIAEDLKRSLREMGYRDVKVNPPLEVLENEELKIMFVIDRASNNIRMRAKGVWTNIYTSPPPIGKGRAEDTERLFDEAGEIVMCKQCGCTDFVRKGEEYICSICCTSNP